MGFSTTTPTGTTEAGQTPSIYTENWNAIEGFLEEEHYTFTSTSSGHHWLGIAGVTMEGTTNAITGVAASPGSGALAFDTTLGVWSFNSSGASGGWKTINTNLPTTRVKAIMVTENTITSGATSQFSMFRDATIAGGFDSLSEFPDASDGTFTAKAPGYFFVSGWSSFSMSTTGGTPTLSLSGSYGGTYRSTSRTIVSTATQTLSLSTIAYIPSGGKVALTMTAPVGMDVTCYADGTGIRIHRVS